MMKDIPVIVMTVIFLMVILGIMVFGMVEDAKYTPHEQAKLNPTTKFMVMQ